jgi:hypothetical protein
MLKKIVKTAGFFISEAPAAPVIEALAFYANLLV